MSGPAQPARHPRRPVRTLRRGSVPRASEASTVGGGLRRQRRHGSPCRQRLRRRGEARLGGGGAGGPGVGCGGRGAAQEWRGCGAMERLRRRRTGVGLGTLAVPAARARRGVTAAAARRRHGRHGAGAGGTGLGWAAVSAAAPRPGPGQRVGAGVGTGAGLGCASTALHRPRPERARAERIDASKKRSREAPGQRRRGSKRTVVARDRTRRKAQIGVTAMGAVLGAGKTQVARERPSRTSVRSTVGSIIGALRRPLRDTRDSTLTCTGSIPRAAKSSAMWWASQIKSAGDSSARHGGR